MDVVAVIKLPWKQHMGRSQLFAATPPVVCTLPQLFNNTTWTLWPGTCFWKALSFCCAAYVDGQGVLVPGWSVYLSFFCLEAMLLDLRCMEVVQVLSPRTEAQSSGQCTRGCWALRGPRLELLYLTARQRRTDLSRTDEQVSGLTGQTAGSAEAEQLKPHPVSMKQGKVSNSTNSTIFSLTANFSSHRMLPPHSLHSCAHTERLNYRHFMALVESWDLLLFPVEIPTLPSPPHPGPKETPLPARGVVWDAYQQRAAKELALKVWSHSSYFFQFLVLGDRKPCSE